MTNNIDEAVTIIAKVLDAHGAGLGSSIENASDRLAREVEKLQSAVWHVVRSMESPSPLYELQLRLEVLVVSFQGCLDICKLAVAEGRSLGDKDFKRVVEAWDECKERAYFAMVTDAKHVLGIMPSLNQHLVKLEEDRIRIEDEAKKSGRMGLIDAVRSFSDDLYVLFSHVKSQPRPGGENSIVAKGIGETKP